MTRKHFQALADMMADLQRDMDDNGNIQFRDVLTALVRFCKTQNPRFDADRFITACNK